MNRINRRFSLSNALISLFVGVFALICLYPFLMVINGSFTSRTAAVMGGFRLIPREFTTDSYTILFANSHTIIKAYQVTIR